MERMLLDLNLPPPPHWSPQAVSVRPPFSDDPSPSPENVQLEDNIDALLERKIETEVSGSRPNVSEVGEDSDPPPDADAPVVRRTMKIQAAEVLEASDSKLGSVSVFTGNYSERLLESCENGPSQSEPKVNVSDPVSVLALPVFYDNQLVKPTSVTVDSNGTKPVDEVPGESVGAVKVHKRLRTLGQLRGKKEEGNAVVAIPDEFLNAEALEDEIFSESGGGNIICVEDDSLLSPRVARTSTQLRSRKGGNNILSSNGYSSLSRDVPRNQIGVKNEGGSGKLRTGESSGLGRFPRIPSQPRSRKPEKRPHFVPQIVVPEVKPEAPIMKTDRSEEKTAGLHDIGKGSRENSIPDVLNVSACSIVEDKSGEPKEQPQVSSEGAQVTGMKRSWGGLKDAMSGKRRRQTVLLEVDESLKQARPMRTPTSEGVQGRISRCRRDTSRPVLIQVSEQESQSNEAVTSLVHMEASTSREVEDTIEESFRLERLKSQRSEVSEQFRRPALKRQASVNFGRNDTIGKGASTFNREDVAKGLDSTAIRSSSICSEGPESQKHRRIPRNTDVKKKSPTIQDASIERLLREVTCSKLWQASGISDLQQVPGRFESVEEYVRVLEPLLFEECRAQLHSSWEELLEGSIKDAHVPVLIKGVEPRERGWYDVIVLPENPHVKFKYKEGDVAVISTPKPGSAGRHKGRIKGASLKEKDGVLMGRVTGIVRRYLPIDVREPHGAVLHVHVVQDVDNVSGRDSACINSNVMKDIDHPGNKGLTWYLTVLGGVTTTQREYVALHFLQQFHPKMLSAVLQPRPELFPGYADQEPPAMPECFTPAFVQHLHGHFNGPQLAAIQWAGAHTAAGNSNTGVAAGVPKQEPWPFTLVQGPPGTGKTHTVWGMLNVIHLVQYQRYYQALLKKLAPSSVTSEETAPSNQGSFENGSLDDVLQRMDDSLARMLPKLCPKPRMLVCAPSNAATDELLSRVLDRGFIDGEMKVYRPDVARVGSDPHSRAAQAVSVERRSEQLLGMGRDQVVGWLQQLKGKEINCSQLIASLQRDLNEVAASRLQGNLGVDPEKLAARDQARDTKLQQLAALVEERDKILVEMSRLFIVEGRFRPGVGFSHDEARQKLEASFANEAEIVFTTVSSSGRRIFTKLAHGFDMVVIDEAAQASEVSVLPPLSLRAARCVLVGDPQQLPATVISRVADTMQYSRSLFERFQQAGCPAILLSVQYRMHPKIRDFPSRYFYQGRLMDSETLKGKPDEVYHKDLLLQPYLFYDISQGRESHGGSVSYQNKLEAQVAVRLYLHLQQVMTAEGIANVSVGMITPYKQQLRCLQSEFEALVGANANSKGVYINTVDAFQGQERDVIMMSCVRASTYGVGFVADIRRMNVALTRARRSLWIIGNAAALLQSEDWAALIADAKARGSIVETSTCIARGLLPENWPGVSVLPQGAPGLLRQAHPGVLPVGRLESPAAHGSSQFGQGSFSLSSFERGRLQDDVPVHGRESDRWPVSEHHASRLHRGGARGNFSQRNLPPNRSLGGRGSPSVPFRRGRS